MASGKAFVFFKIGHFFKFKIALFWAFKLFIFLEYYHFSPTSR
jgi:hypothetical protein